MSEGLPPLPNADRLPRRWPGRLLMLVTDGSGRGERSLPQIVAEAIEGGVNAVQLREKRMPAGEVLALARQLRGICGSRALLLINDRLDVALMCGADGVHLPENGLPVAAARQILPPSMWVGRSVHSIRAARQAELDGATYVLAGTLFPSRSHPETTAAGAGLLRDIQARLTIPIVGIGGIDASNIDECWRAGAAGVAVISAVMGATDPRVAAASLLPMPEDKECA